MNEAQKRAEILIEALPYIQRFSGTTIVVKFGGAAMSNDELSNAFARDIVLLQCVGIKPVIVHGGGPQISSMLENLKIPTEFVDGHRITDSASMDIVEMVLAGKINKSIVSLINNNGGKAVGISGKDGHLAKARPHSLQKADGEFVHLGQVGDLNCDDINPELIISLDNNGFIPVVAPIAVGLDGLSLNINADTMAGAIAGALKAHKLILLTDTPGVLIDNKTATRLGIKEIDELKKNQTISGGMIPKVDCCLKAIKNGVTRTHIIDGRTPHAVLLEIFTDTGIGTLISSEFDTNQEILK